MHVFPLGLRAFATSVLSLAAVLVVSQANAATAGRLQQHALTIARDGKSDAVIVLAPNAGRYERQGAYDLAHYIDMMTGAVLPIAETPEVIEKALASERPLLILGREAFEAKPELRAVLAEKLKKHPYIRTDGIVLHREGKRIYLAGDNDESDYFAVAELLRAWGVRWFMPGDFGECVPNEDELNVGDLDIVYSSPFEIRSFWISWVGEQVGREDFLLRNMMTDGKDLPAAAHNLGTFTKGLGKSVFEMPFTDLATAGHIVDEVDKLYEAQKNISLAMEDGLYSSTNEQDKQLLSLQWDKYMMRPAVTDAMLQLYNNVADKLHERHPESASKLGFLIYSNMFLPPVRNMTLAPSLFGMIAPIDTDPIHGMGDPRSPERQEFRAIFDKWAKLTEGRLAMYDYDQSMLVWRDLPNPSIQEFEQDVKRYRDAGILGFDTESRLALATTFINLYLRGRLMWDPVTDVNGLIDDFCQKFFGPAAKPMADYWNIIFAAWRDTIVTEHEFFVAPAIYTPEVTARLEKPLREAQKIAENIKALNRPLTRNEKLYLQRIEFVRLSYDVLSSYIDMVKEGATNGDYAAAVAAGEGGLTARQKLTEMNGAFTTTKLESGYAFWPGEVQQYRELEADVDGEKGRLLFMLPLEWSFHRDPRRDGLEKGFRDGPIDLSFWQAHHADYSLESRKSYPSDQWEVVRTDLYVQAQGVRSPDGQSALGDLWYRTDFDLTPSQAAASPHILFPGLFNQCALYLNGAEVGQRKYNDIWWMNDYRFEWDVALGDHVRAGANTLALLCHNVHHMGGMFRRPFLYDHVSAPGAR